MSQIKVGVRELKAGLSRYLREVKSGAIVVITERGEPVGRILPIESSSEQQIARLMEAGLLKWNGRKISPSVPRVRLRGSRSVSDLLLEDRQ
jgi:prevent-host-death family protein